MERIQCIEHFHSTYSNVPPPLYHKWCEVDIRKLLSNSIMIVETHLVLFQVLSQLTKIP